MRIAVIAAEMEGRSTGVGRYLEGLLGGLNQWDHGCQWHLFFQGHQVPSGVPENDWVVTHCSGHSGSRVVWEQARLTREINDCDPDVLFGPSYSLPLGYRGPSAVAVHDLSFEIYPEEFGLKERWRRRFLARRSARKAGRVLVLTESIRAQIVRIYALPPHEVSTVPPGVDRRIFSPGSGEEDDRRLADLAVTCPYVLWLGTIFERRMPREVVKSFAGLKEHHPDLRLVIAGANRLRRPAELGTWLGEFGVGDSVIELGWVEEEHLGPLYRRAEVAVYVSRYEGFGLPPLECLACGTPVVVSPGLGLDDLWPDYPFRCPELSAGAIENTAMQALKTPGRASEVIEEAAARSSRWSWENSSRALVGELLKVADR